MEILDTMPVGRIRVRASGARLYAAIDEASERLARGMESHVAVESQDKRRCAAARRMNQIGGRES